MSLVATADIGDLMSVRQRQRLRVSLILAKVFLEVCENELQWALSFHKNEETRKSRGRVEAAQAQVAKAEARKRDAQAAFASLH